MKNITKNYPLGLLMVVSLVTILTAYKIDNDDFSELLAKINAFASRNPQEKVHLQLNKPYYLAGDDIWFKAYLVDAKTKAPSTLSKIIYVELINDLNWVNVRLKLPVISGLSWGNIQIPDTLAEGNYRVRAYTNYMRNAGESFFFDKVIQVNSKWPDNMQLSMQYQFDNNIISAKVHLTDKLGSANPAKEMIYTVSNEHKIIAKGKTKTDASGNSIINFKEDKERKLPVYIHLSMLDGTSKIAKSIPVAMNSISSDIQFLPESGIIIEDMPQKIAVKAINSNGKGENVSITIYDDAHNKITDFSTSYLGIGSFITNFQPGKKYSAKVRFSDGSEKTMQMPGAQKSGYTLSIDNLSPETLRLKVLSSADLLTTGDEIKIVAQQAGNVYFASKLKVNKQLISSRIEKNKLPQGIIQFTLFSKDNKPIAERLIFNRRNDELLDIELDTSSLSSKLKGKSTFGLTAKNKGGILPCSFSVSVTDLNKIRLDEENETNILSSLILTSDLKGYVENPNHYFLKNDDKTNQELDDLMLTQGWRRFTWDQILDGGQQQPSFKPEKSLTVGGTVSKNGKAVAGAKVILLAKQVGGFVLDTLSDEIGRFKFENLLFADTTKFTIQAKSPKGDKNLIITLDSIPYASASEHKNRFDFQININAGLAPYILANDKYFDEMKRLGIQQDGISLREVTIKQQKIKAPNSSNLNGPDAADKIITGKDLENCSGDLLACFSSRLGGLEYRDGRLTLIRDKFGSISSSAPLLYVLDGNDNVDAETIARLSPLNIQSVELLKTIALTAIYGTRGSGGVIIIKTKMDFRA